MEIDREAIVRRSFTQQAELCAAFGSPFTARLLRALEAILTPDTRTGVAILEWQGPPEANGDALALRLAGALHSLVLSGQSPHLAAIYPPNQINGEDEFRSALQRVMSEHDDDLLGWLEFAPQTNEVGRSALLYLGLLEVAHRSGLPLRLFEIGSSAGLNLMLDDYAYRFAGEAYGKTGALLELAADWQGPAPIRADVRIVERHGCDLAPLQLARPEDRLRLQSYVWPDQVDRQQRLQRAIEIAAGRSIILDTGDAGPWVVNAIGADRPEGQATVLMHSLTYCYFPPATKQMISAHLNALGAQATLQSPLAWLAFELNEDNQPELTLQIWPEGEQKLLARAHPHGHIIEYLG